MLNQLPGPRNRAVDAAKLKQEKAVVLSLKVVADAV